MTKLLQRQYKPEYHVFSFPILFSVNSEALELIAEVITLFVEGKFV